MPDERMQKMTAEFQRLMDEFFAIQCRYSAAMKEVQTKLEILDDEFQMRHKRNPIHHIECRMKSIQSMMDKLRRNLRSKRAGTFRRRDLKLLIFISCLLVLLIAGITISFLIMY